MSGSFFAIKPYSFYLCLKKQAEMKRIGLILWVAILVLPTVAQKEIHLNEVKVEAARMVNKADGKLLLPSEAQKQSSTNGYSLLGKLSLSDIQVDVAMHTIKTLSNKGEVQLRLNGALASKEDLMALDPKCIRNIDFIDNPGVRYGEGIAYVINIRTSRSNSGYTVGTELTNSVTTWDGDHSVYARLNHRNSELGLVYDFSYWDFDGDRNKEDADYLLNDGTHYKISREDQQTRDRKFCNNIELKYNLADSASYVFQATLSGNFSHNPGSFNDRQIIDGTQDYEATTLDRDRSFSPVLDLYFCHQLPKHQSMTANVTGTSISTRQYNFNNEGSDYEYHVGGHTWSLMSEAIYENRLKPFSLSFGLQQSVKYTRNIYSGDVESANYMHNSNLYLFGELKGHVKGLGYVAGLGVSDAHYSQGTYHYHFWMFRPKATLTYAILKPLSLRYSFEIYQHISQVAMISDTKIRQNSMEWTVGNPNIEPNRVIKHQVMLACTLPRFTSQIDMQYRVNTNCNMASYTRTADDQFYYTQKNQHGVNMLFLRNSSTYDILPEKLSVSVNGGIFRFFNRGDNYSHYLTAYSYGGSLQAYLGKWTLTFNADNGWKFMEGETWDRQGSATYLTCSYHLGNCDISLYWQHPFENNPKLNYAELVNKNIRKKMVMYGTDYGNGLTIGFSWRLNRGRKYRDIQKKLKNSDTQTGIL